MITGQILPGGADLSEVFAVREAVFVSEQGYSLEIERDENDPRAAHALVRVDGEPAGTGRLFLDENADWHIGRVATLKKFRGQGVGDLAMRLLLMSALNFGAESVYLGSQLHAVPFYEKFGFTADGPEFLDEGQPHLPMRADRAAIERLFTDCAGCNKCKEAAESAHD